MRVASCDSLMSDIARDLSMRFVQCAAQAAFLLGNARQPRNYNVKTARTVWTAKSVWTAWSARSDASGRQKNETTTTGVL